MSEPMTAIEDTLAFQLDALGVPYTREYRAIPGRLTKTPTGGVVLDPFIFYTLENQHWVRKYLTNVY